MPLLLGTSIASEIKLDHIEHVRKLALQGIVPKLAIVRTGENAVIDLYIRLKEKYAHEIGAECVVYAETMDTVMAKLDLLAHESAITGIIVQLPLTNPEKTDQVLAHIAKSKDVDALLGDDLFVPATPQAILWILENNNISLENKKIAILGKGRLVGAPLMKMLDKRAVAYTAFEKGDTLDGVLLSFDIIITATGVPNLIRSEMIASQSAIVDAGTAVEDEKVVGDVEESLRTREDIQITPTKGGVGPLTICALFENLLAAAEKELNLP